MSSDQNRSSSISAVEFGDSSPETVDDASSSVFMRNIVSDIMDRGESRVLTSLVELARTVAFTVHNPLMPRIGNLRIRIHSMSNNQLDDKNPLSERVINSLPVLKMNPELKSKTAECSICLAKFRLRQRVIALKCSHVYHEKCLREWFKNQKICPTCRQEVVKDEQATDIL